MKKHIIFAGCSFSDEGVFEDNFNVELLKNTISYETLRIPNTIKIIGIKNFKDESSKS